MGEVEIESARTDLHVKISPRDCQDQDLVVQPKSKRKSSLPQFWLTTIMAVERAAKRRRLDDGVASALPGFAQVDLEQQHQQRLQKKQKKEKNRLLVKKQNKWMSEEQEQDEGGDASDLEDGQHSQADEKDSGVADLQIKEEPDKPKISPKEEVRLAKEELARSAGLISESPEEHIGLLAGLADIAASPNSTVKKLALGTQLAVFKDIIPGYRIRPLSKDDLQAKISKDVRKLRNFEQGLLHAYKDYVASLDQLCRLKQEVDLGVSSVAMSCVCNLLEAAPHFNCRNELIGIVVRKLSGRTTDGDFTKCRQAIEHLFREDEEGHASLEVVTQLTKMMKSKDYRVDEGVLNTFLHLRLLNEFAHKASTTRVDRDDDDQSKGSKRIKQKKEFRTKRERKQMRERKEVEKEMKEADAAVSYEERDKNQAETLKLVFVAYFRILKARTEHLMGAVLEGLAKYAHLINQDFFGDVLEVLKDLINDAYASLGEASDITNDEDAATTRNATRESLLCIITAFALLQGQQDVAKSANTLHLDLNFFITHLYRCLLPLSLDQEIELSSKSAHLADPNGLPVPTSTATKDAKVNMATTTVLLLRSLQSILLPPTATRAVPPARLAAFVKQLHMAALHLPHKSSLAVLGLLNHVSKMHGKKIAALWYTEERRGDGVFDALSEGVEGSNPFAATVWEGELLRLHWDPKLREAVAGIERNVKDARS
jgi:nucleolar complex protein 3